MKSLFIMMTVFLSINAHALTDSEQAFLMLCGSEKSLQSYAKSLGMKMTKKELNIISYERKDVLNVLENGNIKGFNDAEVLTTCGALKRYKNEIKKLGCYDLQNNYAIKDNGGFKACKI